MTRSFIIAIFFLAFAPFAFAQTVTSGGGNNQTVTSGGGSNNGSSIRLINPLSGVDCSQSNGNCLESFLLNILAFVIRIGSIVVVLMVVYVGYLFVVAQGNETKIIEARKALLWTVIGSLVLLGSQAIAMAIKATVQALGG